MENATTIDVRSGEGLNKEKLQYFIREHIPEAPEGELRIRQFSAGHSNLTYLLQINEWEAVLRRPPLGPVAPKAHDMEREYQILSSLHPYFKPAPKSYVFSKDKEIVGSPFFIMERRNGIVLDTEFPTDTVYTPELGRKISELLVEQLVSLHQVDYKKTKLVDMVKPEGFMERQVAGWIGRYERAKTDDVKDLDELTEYLQRNVPESAEPTIIHYDYKLNNAMFSEDYSEMTGLFDWEMTTVGDPLADVGAAMSYWIQADDPEMLKKGLGKPPVTVMEGFFTRDEFIERYAEKSGRDVSSIDYYLTFAYFKLAVICQQIYYRYKKGQTQDRRFAHFNVFVENLIQYALISARK
ncbi:phosphotransferase family protein [Sporosarcina sp. P12(2017)]|uniref:phosphotransferase family protein n=1 Tax=unclassified Sporosarcina TaxID=2647733 RepID=UPI000C16B440|nr:MULTISPECIES: phosphotransferase family protein [unclassified Sporosarcina]PIC58333.1 phosphotransferase family protein [Sporosarcina sp. P10]PIC61502.1 phosphotransferase family protein [Sporosarcina sp. P12(2017)]